MDGVETRGATAQPMQVLAAWFSPAYPVGGYSYSHGLEWAVEAGEVRCPATLEAWISDSVEFGAGRSDTILLCQAAQANDPARIAELAEALAPSAERRLETMAQGTAFARTTAAAWGADLEPMPYPVAVGRAARLLGLPLLPTATLYLQAFAANLVSAGIRLIPLGQTDGQRIVARMMPTVARVAEAAAASGLDAIGGMAVRADLASMLHETQYTRLYRS